MPLHRSLVFLGGLVVMAFLGWAWMDSMRFRTKWSGEVKGTTRTWFLTVGGGGLMLGGNEYRYHAPYTRGTVEFHRRHWMRSMRESDWLTESGFWGSGFGRVKSGRYWHWSVPFSYMMAGFGPAWLGLSVWRVRRIGRGREVVEADASQ